MKFINAALLAASASLAAAYTNADIPKCALTCIQDAAPKIGCEVKDALCQCQKADDLTTAAIGCVSSSCSAEDALKANTVSTSICEDLTKSSTSSNSTAAVTTPGSGTTPTPTPSATNAAGMVQIGALAAGVPAMMGALMFF